MASLVSLPNELKDLVFAHLSSCDLLKVAATCKVIHVVALPAVYTTLALRWSKAEPNTSIAPEGPDLSSLLLTMINKPKLAGMVKDPSFTAINCMSGAGDGRAQVVLPTRDMPLETELCKRALEVLRKPWSDHLDLLLSEKKGFHIAMGLVIELCTKLESLSIAFDFIPEIESYVEMARFMIRDGSAWLKNLKTWRTTCETELSSPEPFLTQGRFLLPFYLETIGTIKLTALDNFMVRYHFDTSEEEVRYFWPLKVPMASNLTTLRLLRTAAEPEAVGMLLRQSPHLRVLEFHALIHPARTPLDLSGLKSALEHVRATLTHLTVCHKIFADEEYGDPDEQEDITAGIWGSLLRIRLAHI
jgi:hypothetical protein